MKIKEMANEKQAAYKATTQCRYLANVRPVVLRVVSKTSCISIFWELVNE
jgi:hypothetical protein